MRPYGCVIASEGSRGLFESRKRAITAIHWQPPDLEWGDGMGAHTCDCCHVLFPSTNWSSVCRTHPLHDHIHVVVGKRAHCMP
mmetsp:Transcript_30650/g.51807  ORF Transcript_30650/g.51807 Transcript_30650/m.51807 type:complete len:83 (+) Transcript_30650:952-1200(+)